MLKIFIISLLLFTGSSLALLPFANVVAQTPPAETYQPGYWQPVARVDINHPITINLINETGLTLAYSLTKSQIEPFAITPNQTMILKNVKLPLYALIYPNSQSLNNSLIDLKYEVQVTLANIVEVIIKRVENSSESHRTLTVHETGAIYLY